MALEAEQSPLRSLTASLNRANLHASPSKRSARTSPVKGHRDQHQQQHQQPHALASLGGLGRMDIASSSRSKSTSASPAKRRQDSSKCSSANNTQNLDRYIPSRPSALQPHATSNDHTGPIPPPEPLENEDSQHTRDLADSLGLDNSGRILSFFSEPPAPSNDAHHADSLLASYARLPAKGSAATASSQAAAARRRIPTTAERVLDAPGLLDDYYLNLLDWSSSNLVAIALAESIYIWNADSGDVSHLCSVAPADDSVDTPDEYVSSVKFADDGTYLAVGLASGPIQVYDVTSGQLIRTMRGHASRVPALSWSGAVLSSGDRQGEIWNSDVRVAQHKVGEMRGHRGEVCGLTWRPQDAGSVLSGGGQGLLASGGNDNIVNVWDGRMLSAPKMQKTNHTAAVKALAWCPWQPALLASGGGSSDKTVHFWNTTTSARLHSLVTSSQVTSLAFNPHEREFLATHGVPDNHISVWRYSTAGAPSKIVDIPHAHETRILHSAISPDGQVVATASSDENLKFWKVFDAPKSRLRAGGAGRPVGAKDAENDSGLQKRGKTGINVR